MVKPIRFSFSQTGNVGLPFLPITLIYGNNSINVLGLLDTGSTINVMPYDIGLQLGVVWEDQTKSVQLTGNLANLESKALIVSGAVSQFNPVHLVFAWTQANNVPLILGQVNFFKEFDVYFYGSQSAFEIKLK